VTAPDPRLGEIEARLGNLDYVLEYGSADVLHVAAAEDIGYLLTELRKRDDALAAVLEWCDTNQYPWHPSEGVEGAFSSQDWALDDAARRIRTAIRAAVTAAKGDGEL
jgi:hypothetical protein